MLLNYNDDDYLQGYGQIEELFRVLTKNDIFKPYKSDRVFIATIVNDAAEDDVSVDYNLDVFDIRYQKKSEAAHPIKVKFQFVEYVPAGIYGFSLVMTNKLVSLSSVGQRRFDLIQV